MNGLLSVSAARQKLLDSFSAIGISQVLLDRAAGRVLAEEIVSELDLPLFDNSSMDGFALRSADLHGANQGKPVSLEVVADVPAGQVSPVAIGPGQAARIMTGAALPSGADAVVPVEDTDFHERTPGISAPKQVRVYQPLKAGVNVRPRGQDVRKGEVVLSAQRRLRPQDIGFLAMIGAAQVLVYQRPRVAFLSTGDELIPVEVPLSPGKIHESNSYMAAALIEAIGAEPINLGIAADRAEAVKAILDRAVDQQADLILSSAGVSVGAFDYVRSVVEEFGQIAFWRVDMRPGKPLAFGSYRGIPFIGLPGNPVSAYVGFEIFVRPAVMKMSGLSNWSRPTVKVTLAEPVESDGRESYLRASLDHQDSRWLASLAGHQGSGNLRSLVQADALLIVPSGVKSLPAGSEADAWLMD